MRKLKDKVIHCLHNYPNTRNSDIELTIQIWKSFHKDMLLKNRAGKYAGVKLEALFDLPREDNVKRVRAKIQNEEGRYLPTDPKVREKRGILEDQWREYLGYKGPEVYEAHKTTSELDKQLKTALERDTEHIQESLLDVPSVGQVKQSYH